MRWIDRIRAWAAPRTLLPPPLEPETVALIEVARDAAARQERMSADFAEKLLAMADAVVALARTVPEPDAAAWTPIPELDAAVRDAIDDRAGRNHELRETLTTYAWSEIAAGRDPKAIREGVLRGADVDAWDR